MKQKEKEIAIRQAFADYFITEGCSCCRDNEGHTKAEKRLAELLKPDAFKDGSGYDWYKYATGNVSIDK